MGTPQRYIAHFDLDSFFVSVEVLLNPTLKGKPVIVGGSAERGVVSTCSYEARKYGVKSAMPMKTAMQRCPQAIVVQGSYANYTHYSTMVTNVIANRAPLFEKASIDEFYIDLTGMDKYDDPFQWTIRLRDEIIQTTGLPISFGLAGNKMVAKIATDMAKPNGYIQVPPGKEKEFLAPLPVSKISGVGEHTLQILESMGVHTIQQLSQTTRSLLIHRLGKMGESLHEKAQGIHTSPVQPFHEAKSVSSEHTFEENITDTEALITELVRLTEKVAYSLRQDGQLAGCIAVKIRYPDFETRSRQTTITPSCRDDEFIPAAIQLLQDLYATGTPVRLLGVKLSEFTREPSQPTLFEDAAKKQHLYQAIDDVKNKFGKTALQKARTVKKKNNDI
jgi:DNA polymerase IV